MRIKRVISCIFILLLAAVAFAVPASAQQVKWSAEAGQTGDGVYRVVLTADIEKGWHMYDLGPYAFADFFRAGVAKNK